MPNLYDNNVAKGLAVNAQKVSPSSLFGTRDLKFFVLSIDYDLFTDDGNGYNAYKNPDSFYSAIVREIQKVGEIYYLGAPSSEYTDYIAPYSFVFGLASNTVQWQYTEEGSSDYNEIGIDETEPSNSVYPQSGWPERYQPNGDSAVSTLTDTLCYFLRDNFNGPWYLNILEDCGFGLMPGITLY